MVAAVIRNSGIACKICLEYRSVVPSDGMDRTIVI